MRSLHSLGDPGIPPFSVDFASYSQNSDGMRSDNPVVVRFSLDLCVIRQFPIVFCQLRRCMSKSTLLRTILSGIEICAKDFFGVVLGRKICMEIWSVQISNSILCGLITFKV